MIAPAVSPWNGRLPRAISYNTTPSENTSVSAPVGRPSACSGDMYASVPSAVPTPREIARGARRGFRRERRPAVRLLQLREPEVEHLGLAVLGHEDVGRRDVPVDDALGMGGDERIGHLGADPEHVRHRELPALHQLPERAALEQLHDQVGLAVLLADVVDGADVRMTQPRGRAGLALEPLAALRVVGEIPGQHLERDRAVEPRVARPVDLPHPACAQRSGDSVGAEQHARLHDPLRWASARPRRSSV